MADVFSVLAQDHEDVKGLLAEYRPAEGAVRYHWPGRTWAHSLDAPGPASIQIRLGPP